MRHSIHTKLKIQHWRYQQLELYLKEDEHNNNNDNAVNNIQS